MEYEKSKRRKTMARLLDGPASEEGRASKGIIFTMQRKG